MLLDFLEWLALVQKKSDFLRRKRFQRQQVAKAIRHIFTQIPSQTFYPSNLALESLRFRYAGTVSLSVYTIHKHHSLLIVDFSQPHLNNLRVARLHHATSKLRLNRHLAMAAINQHT